MVYALVVLCDCFDCELLEYSQFTIIRISRSKPDLRYKFIYYTECIYIWLEPRGVMDRLIPKLPIIFLNFACWETFCIPSSRSCESTVIQVVNYLVHTNLSSCIISKYSCRKTEYCWHGHSCLQSCCWCFWMAIGNIILCTDGTDRR